MAKRGRPRHPDILTPREWEVLALLREGLTNEQIAERLEITERTARYHVSEILSKLGVSTRQEAAEWRPEERPTWWEVVPWLSLKKGWLASGLAGAVAVATLTAIALLVWGMTRTHSEGASASGASALAVGEGHACVLIDGGVRCWGRNIWGELGDGTTQDRSTAVLVAGLGGRVAAIAAGSGHTCALFPAGNVKCWGYNIYGQLGGGGGVANANSPTAVDVAGLTNAIAISAGGGHTCALTSDGGVKCWGDDILGELGDGTGTATVYNTPVEVAGLTTGVRAIAAGGNFTCALMDTAGVRCWGANVQGQLGAESSQLCGLVPSPSQAASSCSMAPIDVDLGSPYVSAVAIGASGQHVCAEISDGSLKCWGSDLAGELGSNDPAACNGPPPAEPCARAPVEVFGQQTPISGLGLGTYHTCAIASRGAAKCWGNNQSGQLGDGTTTQRNTPVDVMGLSMGVVAIGGGAQHSCALLSSGTVKCWGADDAGQLGDGTTGDVSCSCRSTPVDVVGLAAERNTATVTPEPPDKLAWLADRGGTRIAAVASAICGDESTATGYGVPREMEISSPNPSAGAQSVERTLWLGLEAGPYDYVPAQIRPISDYQSSSTGWELGHRNAPASDEPLGYVEPEIFLRRFDKPNVIFRYGAELCVQPDGAWAGPRAQGAPVTDPTQSIQLPRDLPHIVERRKGNYVSLKDANKAVAKTSPAPRGRVVWAELGAGDDFLDSPGYSHFAPDFLRDPNQVVWVILSALGDGGGPHRAGHDLGSYDVVDATTGAAFGSSCCYDLVLSQ